MKLANFDKKEPLTLHGFSIFNTGKEEILLAAISHNSNSSDIYYFKYKHGEDVLHLIETINPAVFSGLDYPFPFPNSIKIMNKEGDLLVTNDHTRGFGGKLHV